MDDILKKLKTECTFTEVFEEVESNSPSYAPIYRRKLGHLRADFDGYRWWNTWWPCHQDMMNAEYAEELNRLYEALTGTAGFPNLETMIGFCGLHPEASVGLENCGGEYNFYYEGVLCNYWIRLITRRRDYNIYLHAFAREVQ